MSNIASFWWLLPLLALGAAAGAYALSTRRPRLTLLFGIDQAISDFIGVPTSVPADPLTAVARGTGVYLENLDLFGGELASSDD